MKTFMFILARLFLHGICLLFPAVVTTGPAFAIQIETESFEGDDFSFKWVFSYSLPEAPRGFFDFTPDPAKHPGGGVDGSNLIVTWDLKGSFTETDATSRLVLTSQHTRDPHTEAPLVLGEPFEFDREIQSLAQTGPDFTRLFEDVKKHNDSQGAHEDRYGVFYTKNDNNFKFRIEGVHVPEPSGLLLFSSGLAGFVVFRKLILRMQRESI